MDVIFRSQLTLLPGSELSIEDTSNNRSYKIFLVTSWYIFYFRKCFIVPLKFSLTFIILLFSQFDGLFTSIKIKTRRHFQSVFTSIVDAFSCCKVFKEQWDRNRNIDKIMEIFCWIWPSTFTVRINTNHSNSTLVHFVGWLFYAL